MIYLDNSATSYPKPECIINAMSEAMVKYLPTQVLMMIGIKLKINSIAFWHKHLLAMQMYIVRLF